MVTKTAQPEKKKRKPRPTYKAQQMQGDFNDVSSAFSDLEGLRDEVREIVDNASDGLRETQRIQTLESTADTLDGVSEPDLPSCLEGHTFGYAIMVNTNPKKGASRSVRCANACAVFSAAAEAARDLLTESQERRDTPDASEDDISADDEGGVETFIDECEEVVNECESLEFPGMFG